MLKAETPSKAVTPAQVKFLHLLHERGPMTVKEMASTLEKSVQYVNQTILELREKGIIEKTFEGIDPSVPILSWKYKLSVPPDSVAIRTRHIPHRISDEEVRYAAKLRNEGLTGRELQDQFRSKYPHRSKKSILVNIIPRARRYGWCR